MMSSEELKRNNFINSIKFEEDADLKLLKQVQNEISASGNSKNRIIEITKNLSDTQKQKLSDLYKQQIDKLKEDINDCKNKIIVIKKNV